VHHEEEGRVRCHGAPRCLGSGAGLPTPGHLPGGGAYLRGPGEPGPATGQEPPAPRHQTVEVRWTRCCPGLDRMKSARSEAMFQDTVLFVDEMQRLADGFKRGNFSKAKLQGVIQRLLAGTELDT